MNKAVGKNFDLGQASRKIQHMLIDRTLVDSEYKYNLNDLRMKVTIKATLWITGLINITALIK